MGFRNAQDPFGSPSLLVDKLIGTAYDIVKLVATNLPMLSLLGNRIEDLDMIALNLTNTHVLTGVVTGLSQTTNHLLPNTIVQDDIISVNAVLKGTDGKLYFPSTGTFTIAVDLGYLRVTLAAGGPAGMVNGALKATIVTFEDE